MGKQICEVSATSQLWKKLQKIILHQTSRVQQRITPHTTQRERLFARTDSILINSATSTTVLRSREGTAYLLILTGKAPAS